MLDWVCIAQSKRLEIHNPAEAAAQPNLTVHKRQWTKLPLQLAHPHECCREGDYVQAPQHHEQCQSEIAQHQSAGPLNGMLSISCAESGPCRGDAQSEVHKCRQQFLAPGFKDIAPKDKDVRKQLDRSDERKGGVKGPALERLRGAGNITMRTASLEDESPGFRVLFWSA